MEEKAKTSRRKVRFVPATVEKTTFGEDVIVTSGNGFETGEESIISPEQEWTW